MSETVETPEARLQLSQQDRATLRETVKLLYLDGFKPIAISQKTGLNYATIRSWINRMGLVQVSKTLPKQAAQTVVELRLPVSQRSETLKNAGNALRARFSQILDKHAAQFEKVPAKPTLKHLKAIGAAVEPLIRAAKVVHGWEDEKAGSLILTEMLSADDDVTPANAPLACDTPPTPALPAPPKTEEPADPAAQGETPPPAS